MDKKIFEVEISSGGPESYKTSAVLTMPCTQAELCDALQKARVQDVKTCRNELTRIRYPRAEPLPGTVRHGADLPPAGRR